jgi:hypothetical protein
MANSMQTLAYFPGRDRLAILRSHNFTVEVKNTDKRPPQGWNSCWRRFCFHDQYSGISRLSRYHPRSHLPDDMRLVLILLSHVAVFAITDMW